MQLIYRGQTINYTPAPAPAYRQPHAINWRYQIPGETYGEMLPPMTSYRQPRAVNWRYQ